MMLQSIFGMISTKDLKIWAFHSFANSITLRILVCRDNIPKSAFLISNDNVSWPGRSILCQDDIDCLSKKLYDLARGLEYVSWSLGEKIFIYVCRDTSEQIQVTRSHMMYFISLFWIFLFQNIMVQLKNAFNHTLKLNLVMKKLILCFSYAGTSWLPRRV